ncbi:MAG: thiamine pyrophosphate-dependent dehydrogenase E1 component subunit alpha [Gemmatimonadetes bacterium]|nr:thiamine pyrophosphate-dependent dehydrogenase E1 component subunit alpha [Gemmatimonadota bacterium]
MRLTRSLEERLVALYRQGKIPGGLYRSLGQEAEAVAAAYALEPGDVCSPVIRNLGSMLVLGAQPVDVFRQYMAKAGSPTHGRDLHVMFSDLEAGYLGHIAPMGVMIPVIGGVALSFKLRGEPRVALAFSGDGATSTGAFHEGINFAAVQRLPLVVVVENNGFAYSTPTRVETAVERLADKAKAYGILGLTVDGNDALQVYDASRRAVARARAGDGVTLIEAVTYRRAGHAEHDDPRYQSREELEQWERRDPIVQYVERLFAAGWAHPAEFRSINERVNGELGAALEACEQEPLPDPASALTDVYAPDASAASPAAAHPTAGDAAAAGAAGGSVDA